MHVYRPPMIDSSEPTVNEPKVVSQPNVWFDAPIIEEYALDSEDEHEVSTQNLTKAKGIINRGCSNHFQGTWTGKKGLLAEYQDFKWMALLLLVLPICLLILQHANECLTPKAQEQDVNDAAEALKKEFAQETEELLLQAGDTQEMSEALEDESWVDAIIAYWEEGQLNKMGVPEHEGRRAGLVVKISKDIEADRNFLAFDLPSWDSKSIKWMQVPSCMAKLMRGLCVITTRF
ncbi:hypothetical protein Tco_0631542 [Tanacetum coccineum]